LHRLHHAVFVLAFLWLVGLSACGGGGGNPAPPPPPPAAPVITTQPSSLTVNAGSSATFTVTATGATSYRWQRNTQAISGATTASYTLSPATSANNGDSYTVLVANSGGSAQSAAAVLRVTGVAVLAGQIGGEGYADGPAAQARFWGPAALALDSAENLYIADYNAVRKVTPAGDVSTIVGSPRLCGDLAGPGAAARLCYPFALATDIAGNIYVGDGLNTVWKIDTNAVMTAYSTTFNCLSSLAVSDPLLYVGVSCGGAVGSIQTLSTTSPGASATFASVSGSIAGLSFDATQNIYVASGSTIQQVSSAAVVSTLAGTANMPGSSDGVGAAARFGCLTYPVGPNYYTGNGAVSIATLPSGTSYVADYCNNTIRKVTSAGDVTTIGGTAGVPGATDANGTNARFFGPAALVADPNGNVFVADYLNGSIRKITPTGDVTTYAGQTPHAGYTDGAAAQAAFRYPFGVVADAGGNLYITDTYNFVIRKITPAGIVSTLAGTPGVAGYVDATGSAAKFALPQGIAIDASGNLYVADNLNNSVRKVTPAGVVTTYARGAGQISPQFSAPTGVAVDKIGNVYLTDLTGVYEIDPAGTVMPELATLPLATAITVAPNGAIYLTAGTTSSSAGGVFTLGAGNVLSPVAIVGFSDRLPGIVVAGDGNIYVSDLANSVIKQVTPGGAVTVVAGASALPIGTVPGGLPAKINSPSGLALLSAGSSVSLAVVDSFEHAVLRVDLP
jgi:sugar lactone lactonase YvrE